MKRTLKFWLSFLVLLTSWYILPQIVKAQAPPTHGNVSPHIYQDREFFSQDQIDRLEKQNDELADSKQHQITKIFILSPKKMGADFEFPPKYMDFKDFNDPENPAGYIQKTIVDKKSTDSTGYYKGLGAAQAVRKYENVLVFIPEKNSLTFAASSFTSGKYNKWNWQKLNFGHKHQLNNSSSSQAKGVFKIATRINKQQLKLSQRDKPVESQRPWVTFLEKFAIALLATSPLMIIWLVLRFGERSTDIPDFGSDMGWYGGWSERGYYDDMYGDYHDDWHDDSY
ncbi:hypothetical protein LFYK43_06310 [Ligilactobacillus salitolerans]|uniref:Uncharacterized protein n=1 Tax=Ligilactobacillus salitolerans TaxID=1808352 RepID=A0A401IRL0_9LACO|nr:hypothetical protein [Ligilactobacillus salitolerans]GBG94172.1 hypothetical protein LFYK43_06310 [Ligilactobacillus salitolerans]